VFFLPFFAVIFYCQNNRPEVVIQCNRNTVQIYVDLRGRFEPRRGVGAGSGTGVNSVVACGWRQSNSV